MKLKDIFIQEQAYPLNLHLLMNSI